MHPDTETAADALFVVSLLTISMSSLAVLIAFLAPDRLGEPHATVAMLLFGALFVAGLAGLATVARLTRNGGGP